MSSPQCTSTDRPVFVADHRWRQRVVGAAIALIGALLLGWLAAVIAGALGFGNLPALPFTGEGKGSSAAIGSRPKPDSPGQGAAGGAATLGSLTVPRPGGRAGNDPHATSNGGGSTSAARHSGRGVESGSGHNSVSLAAAGGVSTKKGNPRGSAGNRTSDSPPTGNGGAPPTVSGGAGSATTHSLNRTPTATPSGNEIPSGSASGPSGNANGAAESGRGNGRGGIVMAAG